ncbi:hypothetical protein IIW29_00065 [Candidatus Saccharibacteria bacterium]|nr:hypothetical protein [Candidatus Saccharibacteria bacterium]
MDPTTNPTPTPNPAPAPGAPATPPAPAGPTAPVTPPAPEAPAPAPTPGPTPATAAGGMTTPPVNPVINPTAPASGAPAPVGNPAGTQADGLAATDPIMMPEPAPAPDPVEEELKAPMKAAEPAPGSIGSAVSGPATAVAAGGEAPAANPFVNNDKQTPNVAFNDPATQPDAGGNPMAPAKKKTNKTTLIALIIVAVMIVIALGAVLILQLMGDQGGDGGQPTPNTPTAIEDDYVDEDDAEDEADTESGGASTIVACVMGSAESTTTGDDKTASTASSKFSVEYKFVGGKLINMTTISNSASEDGTTSDSSSEVTEFEDLYLAAKSSDSSSAGEINLTELVEEDGTLKVTTSEFAESVEDSGLGYTCTVREE